MKIETTPEQDEDFKWKAERESTTPEEWLAARISDLSRSAADERKAVFLATPAMEELREKLAAIDPAKVSEVAAMLDAKAFE